MPHGSKELYEFDEFRLDIAERRLQRSGGERIQLPDKVFETLCVLVRNSGSLVTKNQLLDEIWEGAFVEENNLDKNISALRRALGEKKGEQIYIETVRKHGYRFVPEVRRIETPEPPASVEESDTTEPGISNFRTQTENWKRNLRSAARNPQFGNVIVPALWRRDDVFENEEPEKEAEETVNPSIGSKEIYLKPSVRFSRKDLRRILIAVAVCVVVAVIALLVWKQMAGDDFAFDAKESANRRIVSQLSLKLGAGGGIYRVEFSPDGDFFAFYQSGEGKAAIYLKQTTGSGDAMKITDGKFLDFSPVFSPDNQQIAFLSDREGDGTLSIWTIPILGGTPSLLVRTELTAQSELRKWSRDGSRIYYQWRGNLYAIELASGQSSTVTDFDFSNRLAWDFSVSPNEQKIAYAKQINGISQIFTQSLGGGAATERQVTEDAGGKKYPAWFPDNRHLAFNSYKSGNSQIYVTDTKSGETAQITFGESDSITPTVAPDGKKIVFLSPKDESNVYSYNLAEHKETAETANLGFQLFPQISPDGGSLAFQSASAMLKSLQSSIKIKPRTADSQSLTVAENGYDAKWSPDGKALAFVRAADGQQNLWRAAVNGRSEKQLTRDGIAYAGFSVVPFYLKGDNYNWSPQGSRLAYSSQKAGRFDIWTISGDGGDETKQTQNQSDDVKFEAPVWSPDGAQIAFLARSIRRNAADKQFYNLCIVGADNRHETIFESSDAVRIVGWSAMDEIFLAVETPGKSEKQAIVTLHKISLGDNKFEMLAPLSGAYSDSFRLASGGRQIAFAARTADGADNIYVAQTTGGEIRQVTDNRDRMLYYSTLGWSPDEKSLYYGKQRTGILISMITAEK
ncbi:MAG TPA: DPP IV N-terminal domain-containing protein [Pyrinomonadaceae bacterium]|jgi:Tol biopolymer transport system component/DNA-binding winged helix-turn-helix (wHTH) protein